MQSPETSMTDVFLPSTLVEAFHIGRQRNQDATAFTFDDGSENFSLTYQQFAKCVYQVKDFLDCYQPNREVIFIVGDSKWNSVIFMGVMSAEAVFFYQPSEVSAFQVEHFIDVLHPRLILVSNASYTDFLLKLPSPPNETADVSFLDHKLIALSHDPRPFAVPLAYAVATSGTTGSPKIVKVPHQCIIPNITHLSEIFGITSSDVVFQSSPLSFDPSVVEMFCAFFCGATLLCTPERVRKQPQFLSNVLLQHRASILQTTPSLMSKFNADAKQAITRNLRVLALGGEPFPSTNAILSWFSSGNKRPRIYNLYGITEVSSWASCYELTDSDIQNEDFEAPIGNSLRGTFFELRKVGVNEQLCIGGDDRVCLVGDEEEVVSRTLRPSGDAVVSKEGRLFCVGRLDHQIKRNGQRLNLDEIEKVVSSVENVLQCAALWDSSLCLLSLCLQSDKNCEQLIRNVQEAIKEKLLAHYHPDRITCVKDFPLTTHGKIDRRSLLKQLNNPHEESNSIDQIFSDLWEEALGTKQAVSDNFIERGGNSLQAVHIHSTLCRALGRENPKLLDLILHSSFGRILENLNGSPNVTLDAENFDISVVVENAERSKDVENDYVLSVSRCGRTLRLSGSEKERVGHSMQVLWSHDTKKCVDASPLIVMKKNGDGIVLIGSHSGLLCSLDLLSGRPIWTSTLPDRIESSACVSRCGNFGVVGCYDGGVYFVNIATGSIWWRFPTKATVKCGPVTHPFHEIVYIGSHDHYLYALNPRSKNCLWKRNLRGSVFASVCFVEEEENLLAASLSGVVFKLNALTGAIIWTHAFQKPIFATPCCYGDFCYIACVDGSLTQLNSSGRKEWCYETTAAIFSSPIVHPTKSAHCILFGCHDNRLHCVSSSGAALWTFSTSSSLYASPFVSTSETVVIASSEGVLYNVNVDNGKERRRCRLPGEVFSSPVCVLCQGRQLLVVGCRNDYVYCVC